MGSLTAKEISDRKLIDNHYYAIANKASLSKPGDLNVPTKKQEAFKEKWGLSWQDALASGRVFNAMDACKHLGINSTELDGIWQIGKNNKLLLKFGGGFYVGEVNPKDLPKGAGKTCCAGKGNDGNSAAANTIKLLGLIGLVAVG